MSRLGSCDCLADHVESQAQDDTLGKSDEQLVDVNLCLNEYLLIELGRYVDLAVEVRQDADLGFLVGIGRVLVYVSIRVRLSLV